VVYTDIFNGKDHIKKLYVYQNVFKINIFTYSTKYQEGVEKLPSREYATDDDACIRVINYN